jgi:hypothetical protein
MSPSSIPAPGEKSHVGFPADTSDQPLAHRRSIVLGAAAWGALTPSLVACSSEASPETAARLVRQAPTPGPSEPAALMRELVRCATLAPSSHNTQCWKFHVQDRAIRIEPDLSRRCPAVDPDNHHLFVSLGCATENLAQAALAHGLKAVARFDPTGDGAVMVDLAPTPTVATPLFQAIPERQCTRGDYDGQPLTADELHLLEQAGSGPGVRLRLLTERPAMDKVLEYVVAGNTAQMNDPAFVAELKAWIRFGASEAVRSGDGLYAGASGNPTMPRWLGSRLMGLFFTPTSENERYARQIRNSAGLAVFASEADDPAHWVEVGRCYERFALQATALGVRNALINQPVEVASIRPRFANWLGLGGRRPDLVVRFGRGPVMPMSMRRPVQDVLV